MTRLQAEILNLILRMANQFPQRKEQLIFIINNYDLMLSVLTVSERRLNARLKGKTRCLQAYTNEDSSECEVVKSLLRDRIDEYVKEVLIPYFSPLISFVRDSEQILSDGNVKQLESNEVRLINRHSLFDARCPFR